MIRLIANPESFDGKPVNVVGFLHIGDSSRILYLSSEDYLHTNLGNGLWLESSSLISENSEKLDMNYVQVVGIFSAKRMGHAGTDAGIARITRCAVWSELKYPRSQKMRDLFKKGTQSPAPPPPN
jgi:hypothetical protein